MQICAQSGEVVNQLILRVWKHFRMFRRVDAATHVESQINDPATADNRIAREANKFVVRWVWEMATKSPLLASPDGCRKIARQTFGISIECAGAIY